MRMVWGRLYKHKRGKGSAHFSVLGEIDLKSFPIVLESKRAHGKEDVLSVDCFPLLLLTLFRGYNTTKFCQPIEKKSAS